MNYLGHAFLSFGDGEILTGNMLGDYVKGKLALEKYPPGIKKGILLHRRIDAFTDEHPVLQRVKILFRPDYGLYAGAIADSIFDHFLANDAQYFPSEKQLLDFTTDTYRQLEQHASFFTERFAMTFMHMKGHNWLYNYRMVKGMERALAGLAGRAKYMPPADKAYQTFMAHYYSLNQSYYEFIDDVVSFVKIELSK